MCFLIKNAWWWQKFFAIWYILFDKFDKTKFKLQLHCHEYIKTYSKKERGCKRFYVKFLQDLREKLLGPFLFQIKI